MTRGVRREGCEVEGCERPHYGDGLCNLHYLRRRRGIPMDLPLRAPAMSVDGWSSWYVNSGGYRERRRRRNGAQDRQLEHRWVMEQELGRPLLTHENVHHLNGDRTDNRRENLELWVTMQPTGKRVEDLIAYAREILERYAA